MTIRSFPTAVGVALIAAVPAAHAQTMITEPAGTVVSQPLSVKTVQTVETIRTVPGTPAVRRRIVTRQTVVRRTVVPAPAVAAVSRPLYDVVLAPVAPAPAPAPVWSRSYYDYDGDYAQPVASTPAPLYDVVAPAPAVAAPVVSSAPLYDTVVAAPVSTTAPAYRYVYQDDRILVIDPVTNLTVGVLPR